MDCRHHWIIEPPAGATSMGRCKRCGAEKEFPNSLVGWDWGRQSAQFRSRPQENVVKDAKVEREKKSKFRESQGRELVEIGITAFGDKYGYGGGACRSMLLVSARLWRKRFGLPEGTREELLAGSGPIEKAVSQQADLLAAVNVPAGCMVVRVIAPRISFVCMLSADVSRQVMDLIGAGVMEAIREGQVETWNCKGR
jgi:hypothetical protein